MSQEDVTKNAPNWLEESGIASYREGKTEEQEVQSSDDQFQKDQEIARRAIDKLGLVESDMESQAETVLSRQNPYSATGLEDEYVFEGKEYDQGFWADAGAGLWNGLVVGGGEGLANLAPTVAQALGAEGEFLNAWSTGVSEFFENQKMIYSDAANKEIDGFGDINSAHVGRALGQGIGFLAGIIGTGGALGAVSTGGKVLSRASKIHKGLVAAEKAATGSAKVAAAARLASFSGRTAQTLNKASKGQQMASRIGTFMAGTTLMYPEIQKEAKNAGLSNGAAARFALGVSGLVSMTEGVALEWIGKAASKPLTKAIANKSVKEALLSGTKNPTALKKIFVENYTKALSKGALRNKAAIVAEGSAIEFGQEFSQTYIEEGAKQLYDTVYKGENKGEFGADVTTYKSFVESVFGGLIGAALGGGMAITQSGRGLGDSLTKEGLFGYINNAVETGDKSRITNLQEAITNLRDSGKMSKSESSQAEKLIGELQTFAENVKTSDIEDGVAKYQLFQLDRTGKNADIVSEKINPENTTNPKLKEEANKKKSQINTVKNHINDNFTKIYDSKASEKVEGEEDNKKFQKKNLADGQTSSEQETQEQETQEEEVPVPSNKVAFDTKIEMYEQLLIDIAEGRVSDEQLPQRLSDIDSTTKLREGNSQEQIIVDGVSIPLEVVDNPESISDITNSFDLIEQGELTEEDFYKQMQEKYGLSKEQVDQITNEDFAQNYKNFKLQSKEGGKAKLPKFKKEETKEKKETYIEKQSRKKALKEKEEQLNRALKRLDVSDEQRNLEDQLLQAEDKVEQAETNNEKAKARREFKEASKKLREFKTEEGKKSTVFKLSISAAKDRIINEINKVVAERAIVEQEIKEMAEKSEPVSENESVKDNKEFIKTQKDAVEILEKRKSELEKDLKSKEPKVREKAKKDLKVIDKKINKIKKEIAASEIKTDSQIIDESNYSKKSLEQLEKDRDKLIQDKKNLGSTPDLFIFSDIQNKIKSIKKEINKRKVEAQKAKAEEKSKSPNLKSQIGQRVIWNSDAWVLEKEGNNYVLVSQDGKRIVNIPGTDNTTLQEANLDLKPSTKKTSKGKAKKRKFSNFSNEGVNINGIDYVFVLDEKGNIIELAPVKKGLKSITNEDALVEAEIGRNRFDVNSLTEEEITDEVVDNTLRENPSLQRVDTIGAEGFTDIVDSGFKKLFKNKPLSNEEWLAVNEYLENVLDSSLKAYLESPTVEMNEFYEKMSLFKKQLYEQAEERIAKEDINERKEKSRSSKRKQKEYEEIEQDDSYDDKVIEARQKARKEAGVEENIIEEIFEDVGESESKVLEDLDKGEPINPLNAQYTADYLYSKYQQLERLKNNPKRQYTLEQINEAMFQIEEDITALSEISGMEEGSYLLGEQSLPDNYLEDSIEKNKPAKLSRSEQKRKSREQSKKRSAEKRKKLAEDKKAKLEELSKEQAAAREVNDEVELDRLIEEEANLKDETEAKKVLEEMRQKNPLPKRKKSDNNKSSQRTRKPNAVQTSLEERFDGIDRASELEEQIETKANEIRDNADEIQNIETVNDDPNSYQNLINKGIATPEGKPTKEAVEKGTKYKVGKNSDTLPTKTSKKGIPSIDGFVDSLIDEVIDEDVTISPEEMFQYVLDYLGNPGGIADWREVAFRKQELKQRKAELKKQEQEYEAMEAELNDLKSKFPEDLETPVQTTEEQGLKEEVVDEEQKLKKENTVENKIKEEFKPNDEKSSDDNFKDFLTKREDLPPFQKKSFVQSDESKKKFTDNEKSSETIAENPGLFFFIKNKLKKMFPNITVEIIDSMLEKYGVDALGSAFKGVVNIQRDSAQQTTIIHEFAHIYVDMLGRDHPLVKMGLDLVKDTELHKRAKKEYPELSEQDQLMEALVESIAIKGLGQLRTNFEGTKLQKIQAWLKRFWNRIKGLVNKNAYNEIDAITRKMLDGSVKDKNGLSSKVQFQKRLSNAYLGAVNITTGAVARLRMAAVRNPRIKFNDLDTVKAEIYSNLWRRYQQEKDTDQVTTNPIFQDINLEEPSVANLYDAIQKKDKKLFDFIENTSKSVSNVSRFEIEEEADQNEEGLKKPDSDNAIKADKGFSPSVKSVLSSMVDNQGNPIDVNEVFRYVASVASNSINDQDFYRRVKERRDRNSDNIISDRVYTILESMPIDDRQLLIFEMASAVQTPFKKFALLENFRKGEGNDNKLVIRQLNKNYEAGVAAKGMLENIRAFSDQDALDTKKEVFGDRYPGASLAQLIRGTGYFGVRFSPENISRVTEKDRQQYNQIISKIVGEEVPMSYTNNSIIDKIGTGDRTTAQNALQRFYSQTQTTEEGRPTFTADINNSLEKIAKEIDGTDSLTNSFINSSGQNVSSTGLGHSMTDVINRYRDDVANPKRLAEAKKVVKNLKETNGTDAQIKEAQSLVDDITEAIETKKQYQKSPIYRNNTVLNRADKKENNGVIDYFNADAIDANGKVRELSGQTKDDIMITQLMGFANDTDKKDYSQQYGIQGDRPKTQFFKVPRFKGSSLKKAYEELKEVDDYLYKEFKEKAKKKHGKNIAKYNEALDQYRDTYNKSTLNYMNENGTIVIPQENNDRRKLVNNKRNIIKTALKTAGLSSQLKKDKDTGEEFLTPSIIGADHIGENKLYKDENDLIENFIYNESLNRNHLNNLFQGPIAHRKSIEDHIKRALGTNSTGNKVNIDKPVVTVVIKADSKRLKDGNGKAIATSDSFSINGERLHSHIAKKVGGVDRLGSNMKDLLFQVDPYSGNMTFLKMSSMGIIGDESKNNFIEMGAPKYAKGRVGYPQLAQIAFALEKEVGEGKYIKIVDENAIKGNEGKDIVPIDIDALLTTDPKSIIENNSFELKYRGYRTPFKMNKSLAKIDLKDQSVVGSSQLMKIAGNTGHPKQIIEFEDKLVKLLKNQLGIDKGKSYQDSKLYEALSDTNKLINGVLKGAEESGKQSIANVLNAVNEHNKNLQKKAGPLERKIIALEKNNPVISERSDELVKEIQQNQSQVDEILKDKITALDHPNTKAQIEQYIGSRMGRQSARPEMSGAYLQMLPDYGRTLKAPKKQKVAIKNKIKFKKKIAINKTKLARLKENNAKPELIKKQSDYVKKLEQERKDGIREILTDFEVATPWSMWGKTREEAEAFIKARKESGVPVKVVVVRVPASIGVSTFAADVAYLTDGEANTVVTPDEFIKMSDADHDGDKAFVYREELETKKEKVKDEKGKEVLDEEGNPTTKQFTKEVMGGRSDKSILFWNLYTQISSDEIREQHSEDLTTDVIKEIVEEIEGETKKTELDYNLNTFEDLADVLSKYSFGAKAIGIEAVAGKMLSMFTQSGVKLTEKGAVYFNGKIYDKFVSDNAIELAKVLQAALDLGNDPILLKTGINKHTIGAANVMLSLGVPLKQVIKTLKSEAIGNLVKLVDKNTSVFSPSAVTFQDALANEKISLAKIESIDISQSEFNRKKDSVVRIETAIRARNKKVWNDSKPVKLKENTNYQTRESKNGETKPITFKIVDGNIVESSPDIKNEADQEKYSLMESFVEFANLSDEINQILPVIQRDNKMPNNSAELRSTKKAFNKLRKGLLVDFKPLLDRPLTGHYESVVDLMINLEEKHFATEKGSYSQSDNNMIDQVESAVNRYGTKSAARGMVVDVFQRMVAQGSTKVASPKQFISELPNQLESLLSYQNKEEFKSNFDSLFNEQTGKDGIDVFIEAIIDVEQRTTDRNSVEYKDAVKLMTNSLDSKKEIDLAMKYLDQARNQINSFSSPELKDNLFLKHIQVKQAVTGSNVKTIVPVDNYRKVSLEVKEQIRNDFKKLYNTSVGQSIYKYQMLRNGVSDKIGSLADLMPEEISVNFLKKMTAFKDTDAVQPRFPKGYEYNALMSMKEYLQDVKIAPNQGYLTQGWAVDNGEIVKIPKPQGKSLVSLNTKIPAIRTSTFVKNDNYKFIKFDPNATIKETSYQEMEQIKKQCKPNIKL